eukprot:g5423.t1
MRSGLFGTGGAAYLRAKESEEGSDLWSLAEKRARSAVAAWTRIGASKPAVFLAVLSILEDDFLKEDETISACREVDIENFSNSIVEKDAAILIQKMFRGVIVQKKQKKKRKKERKKERKERKRKREERRKKRKEKKKERRSKEEVEQGEIELPQVVKEEIELPEIVEETEEPKEDKVAVEYKEVEVGIMNDGSTESLDVAIEAEKTKLLEGEDIIGIAFETVLTGETLKLIAAGPEHSMGIDSGGTVYAWGENCDQRCGVKGAAQIAVPTRITIKCKAEIVACGDNFTLIVGRRNFETRIYSCGANVHGQLGRKNEGKTMGEIKSLRGKRIINVSASKHCLAVSADGSLYSWGDNSAGQLGLGDLFDRDEPSLVPCHDLKRDSEIDTNDDEWDQFLHLRRYNDSKDKYYSLMEKFETKELEEAEAEFENQKEIAQKGNIFYTCEIACGHSHSIVVAMRRNGFGGSQRRVYAWGGNKEGELGFVFENENGTSDVMKGSTLVPTRVQFFDARLPSMVGAADGQSVVVTNMNEDISSMPALRTAFTVSEDELFEKVREVVDSYEKKDARRSRMFSGSANRLFHQPIQWVKDHHPQETSLIKRIKKLRSMSFWPEKRKRDNDKFLLHLIKRNVIELMRDCRIRMSTNFNVEEMKKAVKSIEEWVAYIGLQEKSLRTRSALPFLVEEGGPREKISNAAAKKEKFDEVEVFWQKKMQEVAHLKPFIHSTISVTVGPGSLGIGLEPVIEETGALLNGFRNVHFKKGVIEESECKPGMILLKVNGDDVTALPFDDILEKLSVTDGERHLVFGSVVLESGEVSPPTCVIQKTEEEESITPTEAMIILTEEELYEKEVCAASFLQRHYRARKMRQLFPVMLVEQRRLKEKERIKKVKADEAERIRLLEQRIRKEVLQEISDRAEHHPHVCSRCKQPTKEVSKSNSYKEKFHSADLIMKASINSKCRKRVKEMRYLRREKKSLDLVEKKRKKYPPINNNEPTNELTDVILPSLYKHAKNNEGMILEYKEKKWSANVYFKKSTDEILQERRKKRYERERLEQLRSRVYYATRQQRFLTGDEFGASPHELSENK